MQIVLTSGKDTVPLPVPANQTLCTCTVFPTQALPGQFHECSSLQPWGWPEPLITHPGVLPNGPTREALAVHPPGPASPSSSAAGGRSARRSARAPHTTSLVSVAGPGCAQRAQHLFPGLIFPRFLPSGPPQGHPGENRSPSQPQPWVCFQLFFPACTHTLTLTAVRYGSDTCGEQERGGSYPGSGVGCTGWERQYLSVCCRHLPQGLSAGKCEPHWTGLLSRLSLKSERREGEREREHEGPIC